MIKPQIKKVIQNILSELEHQSMSLRELKVLIMRQSILLQNKDYYNFRKSNLYKKKLLKKINNHKKRLLDIKIKWCKFKQNSSQEIQSKVSQKINEIRHIVEKIGLIENHIYNKIMNEVNNQVEN